ncbi:MAG: hypothetical protein AB7K71_16590, partial [Polyangiaceae bacterium]
PLAFASDMAGLRVSGRAQRQEGQMDFMQTMHAYFRGEKLEAAFFIVPVGLLFLGLAYGAWRSESGGFMWAVIVPSVILGATLLAVGVTVAGRTAGQLAALEQAYQQDVALMVKTELPRMRQVMTLFSRTLPAFGVLALLGLILRYAVRTEWAIGLGALLVAAGGVGMLIDGFAERRAHPYVRALEALDAQHGR